MKVLDRFSAICSRVLTPKWAHDPVSGAGAALRGGRANRPGVDALYLALDVHTAVAEYQQLSPLMPPGTLVNYEVSFGPVVDFRAGYVRGPWNPLWQDFFCEWRGLVFDQNIEPPSWVLGDLVMAAGAKGILFGSRLVPGGINLVLYTGHLNDADILKPYDPGQFLPKNADSWN